MNARPLVVFVAPLLFAGCLSANRNVRLSTIAGENPPATRDSGEIVTGSDCQFVVFPVFAKLASPEAAFADAARQLPANSVGMASVEITRIEYFDFLIFRIECFKVKGNVVFKE